MYFKRGDTDFGGIFSLSPTSTMGRTPFPAGFISLVSDRYDYLLDAPNDVCQSSYHLGLGDRYDNGILCKVPLRALKVYSRDLKDDGTAPSLKVDVWFNNRAGVKAHTTTYPSTSQFFPFHQIGDNGKSNRQGYALPVIPSMSVSYRLSLSNGSRDIPSSWVVEFNDPVIGNRWGEEYIQLELRGRKCADNGVVSCYHDRRFIYSGQDFLNDNVWGNHGACVQATKTPAVSCRYHGDLKASECPELCGSECLSDYSYCDCRTAACRCKVGYMGDDCSIDFCTDRCGSRGACAGLYLGATLPIHSSEHDCVG
jgi:hypothetical protein